MSKLEILAELPRLSPQERAEILERLWHLEEAAGPNERECTLLNEAQADYDANPSASTPWREVERPAPPTDVSWMVLLRPAAERDLAAARDWHEHRSHPRYFDKS
jgi:hypothetical protein